jgi:hypothetical protein
MMDAYNVAETIVEDLTSPRGPIDLAAEDTRAGAGGDEKKLLEIVNRSPSMHSLPRGKKDKYNFGTGNRWMRKSLPIARHPTRVSDCAPAARWEYDVMEE